MNNECDIQVNAKVIRPACNLPNILLPLPPQYLSQDARIVKSSPCFNILMSFFLYLLILIRAGIVSCVYVRVVIIVVINDSSILTTGLNTTLEYLQSAPHNKTRNTRVGGQQIQNEKWTNMNSPGPIRQTQCHDRNGVWSVVSLYMTQPSMYTCAQAPIGYSDPATKKADQWQGSLQPIWE